jgi:hypothetical protein
VSRNSLFTFAASPLTIRLTPAFPPADLSVVIAAPIERSGADACGRVVAAPHTVGLSVVWYDALVPTGPVLGAGDTGLRAQTVGRATGSAAECTQRGAFAARVRFRDGMDTVVAFGELQLGPSALPICSKNALAYPVRRLSRLRRPQLASILREGRKSAK